MTGTIQCAVPGDDKMECDGGYPYGYFNYGPVRWGNLMAYQDGLEHGVCGNPATITFSDINGSGSGYEVVNGSIARNRPIFNITGYTLNEGTYKVIWNSTDGKDRYNHYGLLNITNIDNDHPNHS